MLNLLSIATVKYSWQAGKNCIASFKIANILKLFKIKLAKD